MVKETHGRYTVQKRNIRTGKLEWWCRRGGREALKRLIGNRKALSSRLDQLIGR